MTAPLHTGSGARALNALPPDEAAAFDAHLTDCESCTDEYAEFLETAALLGSAVAETPPESLHTTLMRLIAVTPQSPPPDLRGADRADDQPPRPWYRRPVALLAAAVAALVVIAGGVVIAVRGDQGPMTAEQCVQQAADLQVSSPSVGAGGTVRYSQACGAAIVSAPEMPELPTDRDYQLWVMAGTDAVSVGVVPAQATESGVVVPVGPADTDIGISVEPKGGSPAPTTAPVWVVPLP